MEICKCYTTPCVDTTVVGFALIKMRPPTGFTGSIYNPALGVHYPRNWVNKAVIDEFGCWTSCDLPYSDLLEPQVWYDVAEFIYGDGACNGECGCGNGECGCLETCPEQNVCSIWLDSTAGYDETQCLPFTNALCKDFEEPTFDKPCNYIGVNFILDTIPTDPTVTAPAWLAPHDGTVYINFVSYSGPAILEAVTYSIIDETDAVLCTGTIPSGQNSVVATCELAVLQNDSLRFSVSGITVPLSAAFVAQGEFKWCEV